MHSLVFVLVPSTTNNIKATVEQLLAGSDNNPEKQFQSYTLPCSCIGSKAVFESYRTFEATPQGGDLLVRLTQARAKQDQTTAEKLLLQQFTAARAIAKEHPAYRQPDPECDLCHGTGISTHSRNPRNQWDYWSIGGEWSGLFAALLSPASADKELDTNIARIRDIPNDVLPAAIVTPEGDWYAGPIVMEDELFEPHREDEDLRPRNDGAEEARGLLSHYPEHFAVVVDCHS